jgi:hypothetical protein
VRDVDLAGGAVRVPAVAATYSLSGLLASRVDSIEVRNPRVAIALAGGRVTLGGRPLPAGGASGGGGTSGGVRIDSLKLVDAAVAVDGPGGKLEATFSTSLALAGGTLSDASFVVDAVVPVAGAPQRVRIAVPRFAVTPVGTGISIGLSFSGGIAGLKTDHAPAAMSGSRWRASA